MIPFAVAAVQMNISASQENVSAMKQKVDQVMARFPWVQMIVFSELATYGPLPGQHKDSIEFIEEQFFSSIPPVECRTLCVGSERLWGRRPGRRDIASLVEVFPGDQARL